MSSLGEWDDTPPAIAADDKPSDDVVQRPPVTDRVAAAVSGLDVDAIAGGLVSATVSSEIHRQIQREVTPVVTAAVAEVLTPERLEALRVAAVQAAEAELNPPQQQEEEGDDDDASPTLYYGSVDEFVREFVCPVFRRVVGGRSEYRWSARWWESAEAIIRLEAMWRAWEHLRLDPATGMSVWVRDHADHHLGVLMGSGGPWARSKDSAGPDEPLPYEAPPDGLFPDVRTPSPTRPAVPRVPRS